MCVCVCVRTCVGKCVVWTHEEVCVFNMYIYIYTYICVSLTFSVCVYACIYVYTQSVWACNMYTFAYLCVHMHPNYQRRLLLGAPVPRGASTTALRKLTRVLAESLPQRSPSVHGHVRLVISNCPSAGGYMVLMCIRYILHSLHFNSLHLTVSLSLFNTNPCSCKVTVTTDTCKE